MTITEQHIHDTLNAYLGRHPEDKNSLSGLFQVLDEAGGHIVGRREFRGHVTAGALLLRPDCRVLLVEHKALGKWLFPGGHLEDEDSTLMLAALRELAEETGIHPDLVTPVGPVPLHIDVHPIAANPAKDEPDHQHFDFRFLFRTTADVSALQAEEVLDYSWRFADTITAEPLRTRLLAAPAH
ncbi:NUDIX hydrolase [Streptomyces sp. NBC_01477]|uniref:NUDIX hydrolase n=1 Tax=Streptomyces sp. NBC_01477 TaxID=2976015 RepID=UPI002E2F1275|nr:NUDIX domain-containing protein [Streptomyces sp. NBC_01477]